MEECRKNGFVTTAAHIFRKPQQERLWGIQKLCNT